MPKFWATVGSIFVWTVGIITFLPKQVYSVLSKPHVNGLLMALLCAGFWIAVAFSLAYPKILFRLDHMWDVTSVNAVAVAFFGSDIGFRISLPMFITTDVMIERALNNGAPRALPNWAWHVMAISVFIYLILVVIVPFANPNLALETGDPTLPASGYLGLLLFALSLLLLVRFTTFLRPTTFEKYQAPAA